jgi:hypothetical protein
MRCYFMRKGRIVGVEELNTTDNAEAVKRAKELFAARKGLDGFEVWNRAQFLHRYPPDSNSMKTSDSDSSAA